eukprot:Pgem_evm1s13192
MANFNFQNLVVSLVVQVVVWFMLEVLEEEEKFVNYNGQKIKLSVLLMEAKTSQE